MPSQMATGCRPDRRAPAADETAPPSVTTHKVSQCSLPNHRQTACLCVCSAKFPAFWYRSVGRQGGEIALGMGALLLMTRSRRAITVGVREPSSTQPSAYRDDAMLLQSNPLGPWRGRTTRSQPSEFPGRVLSRATRARRRLAWGGAAHRHQHKLDIELSFPPSHCRKPSPISSEASCHVENHLL